MTIRAIETEYAGYRFRSRLEARYAVGFDAAGIRWEYEPQGFELAHRITGRPGAIRYLPDFWLPDLGLWAEVKGSLTEPELLRLYDVAAALSAPSGGAQCHVPQAARKGHDMLLLGPLPHEGFHAAPWRLHMHKGDLFVGHWNNECPGGTRVADDASNGETYKAVMARLDPALFVESLLSPKWRESSPVTDLWTRVYEAARRARFEHGESPASSWLPADIAPLFGSPRKSFFGRRR